MRAYIGKLEEQRDAVVLDLDVMHEPVAQAHDFVRQAEEPAEQIRVVRSLLRERAAAVHRELTHDGDPVLERNVLNAATRETRWGLSIMKDHKDSPRKIDAAVAAAATRRPGAKR